MSGKMPKNEARGRAQTLKIQKKPTRENLKIATNIYYNSLIKSNLKIDIFANISRHEPEIRAPVAIQPDGQQLRRMNYRLFQPMQLDSYSVRV